MADGTSPLDELFHRPGVTPYLPASEWDIEEVELRGEFRLPEAVRNLYRRANGAKLSRGVELLTLGEAESLAASINPATGGPTTFWLFPLTENNDSNHVCVVCRSPLAGYVVHIFHDNDPRLLYRSSDEFFAALARFLAASGTRLEKLPTPFAEPERTDEDRGIARELIALAEGTSLPEPDDTWVYHFSVALLGQDDVPDLARLLTHDNEYVRWAAEERLEEIRTSDAVSARAAYRADHRRFARRVQAELTATGIEAHLTGDRGQESVRVEPGSIYLNLASFYPLRNEPDGFARIVQRVRTLMSQRR